MYTAQQLAYLVLEVRDATAWEAFATSVLGLTVDRRLDNGGLTLRMDERPMRFLLREGPADDLFAAGWQVEGAAALTDLQDKLNIKEIAWEALDPVELEHRSMEGGIVLTDPGGNRTEIVHGPRSVTEPFHSQVVPGGFVTGQQGLGHIVLRCTDKAESVAFYTDVLGFRLSDRIQCTYFGLAVDIDFFHTQLEAGGSRHHSLALSEPIEGVPTPHALFHFMIEAREMDAVGAAYDRAIGAGVPLAQTLGRHPNDEMFSFYAITPSGFQVEFGWGGKTVDDTDWEPTVYDHLSTWGHHPPAMLSPRRKKERS